LGTWEGGRPCSRRQSVQNYSISSAGSNRPPARGKTRNPFIEHTPVTAITARPREPAIINPPPPEKGAIRIPGRKNTPPPPIVQLGLGRKRKFPHPLYAAGDPAEPNREWSGDITYSASEEGWLFLAVVIVLFRRKVVGWSMRPDMHRSLVIDALEMGLFQRRPAKGELIFHRDRGSQYASEDFHRVIGRRQIRASMSRKGNCWDNAVKETLFGSLKVERLHGRCF